MQKALRPNPEEIFRISEKSSKNALFGGDFGGEGGKRPTSWLLEKFLDFCSKATCKKLGKSYGQFSRSYLEWADLLVIKCLKVYCFPRGPSPWKTYRSVSGILPPSGGNECIGKSGDIVVERVARATLTNVAHSSTGWSTRQAFGQRAIFVTEMSGTAFCDRLSFKCYHYLILLVLWSLHHASVW